MTRPSPAAGPLIGQNEAMNSTLDDFTREEFTFQGKARDIYRLGSGPAVLVIAEIPGIGGP